MTPPSPYIPIILLVATREFLEIFTGITNRVVPLFFPHPATEFLSSVPCRTFYALRVLAGVASFGFAAAFMISVEIVSVEYRMILGILINASGIFFLGFQDLVLVDLWQPSKVPLW